MTSSPAPASTADQQETFIKKPEEKAAPGVKSYEVSVQSVAQDKPAEPAKKPMTEHDLVSNAIDAKVNLNSFLQDKKEGEQPAEPSKNPEHSAAQAEPEKPAP